MDFLDDDSILAVEKCGSLWRFDSGHRDRARTNPGIDRRVRIRDVILGPDGSPYIVLNFPNGMILRLAGHSS